MSLSNSCLPGVITGFGLKSYELALQAFYVSSFATLQVASCRLQVGEIRRITIIINDMKKTKIVATISDKRCEVEFFREVISCRDERGTVEYYSSGYGAGVEGGGECSESFG